MVAAGGEVCCLTAATVSRHRILPSCLSRSEAHQQLIGSLASCQGETPSCTVTHCIQVLVCAKPYRP